MKDVKQQLSDEISKGKRKKRMKNALIAFALLSAFNVSVLCFGYWVGTKWLKEWLPVLAGALILATFFATMSHAWDKEKEPTDDEIKALAQKEIDKMDMSEDMTGEIDEERREKLKKIIND